MAKMYQRRNLAKARRAKRVKQRLTLNTSKAKRTSIKQQLKPVSEKDIRKSVKKGQLRFRKTTLEVRKAISQRGRTHPMEAPIPGMPETPQQLLMDSTAIRRFKYWTDENRLRIWFVEKGVYDYYDVPESIIITLSQAPSKGRYFYYNIRTSFEFKRIR